MTQKPQQFKIDWMLFIGASATIACITVGNVMWLALPISVFTFVLAILRIWIKPKQGQRFFAPGIWWGTIYGSLGVLFTIVPLLTRDNLGIGPIVSATAFLQMVVPGFLVTFLGYRRTIAVNKSTMAPASQRSPLE